MKRINKVEEKLIMLGVENYDVDATFDEAFQGYINEDPNEEKIN